MAIVILGGLLSATALNMLVLPALYWLFGDRTVDAPVSDVERVGDEARGTPEPAFATGRA